MAKIPRLEILTDQQVESIKDASVMILRDAGIMVHNDQMLGLLGEAGAKVDRGRKVARLPEKLVMGCLARAQKQYVLYSREGQHVTA